MISNINPSTTTSTNSHVSRAYSSSLPRAESSSVSSLQQASPISHISEIAVVDPLTFDPFKRGDVLLVDRCGHTYTQASWTTYVDKSGKVETTMIKCPISGELVPKKLSRNIDFEKMFDAVDIEDPKILEHLSTMRPDLQIEQLHSIRIQKQLKINLLQQKNDRLLEEKDRLQAQLEKVQSAASRASSSQTSCSETSTACVTNSVDVTRLMQSTEGAMMRQFFSQVMSETLQLQNVCTRQDFTELQTLQAELYRAKEEMAQLKLILQEKETKESQTTKQFDKALDKITELERQIAVLRAQNNTLEFDKARSTRKNKTLIKERRGITALNQDLKEEVAGYKGSIIISKNTCFVNQLQGLWNQR